ncbi:unnamed protein product [Paramecium sonneborni]|uniref:Uncharacterized protein n=1 Tax=Paramecium sonneborni TaxID=65129 RepID=A0A8S1PVZ1_9CILI|nr:unnamed protein product [Paramecium sonneborni]
MLGVKQAAIEALVETGITILKGLVGSYFDASCYSVSQPDVGCVWITYLDGTRLKQNGKVASLFYHPTKQHTATTTGKLGQKRSVAGPGEWAISEQTKGAFGNQAFYNTL